MHCLILVNERLSNTKTKKIIKDVSIVEVKCKMVFQIKHAEREIRSGMPYIWEPSHFVDRVSFCCWLPCIWEPFLFLR